MPQSTIIMLHIYVEVAGIYVVKGLTLCISFINYKLVNSVCFI